jgi:hypothetical protein
MFSEHKNAVVDKAVLASLMYLSPGRRSIFTRIDHTWSHNRNSYKPDHSTAFDQLPVSVTIKLVYLKILLCCNVLKIMAFLCNLELKKWTANPSLFYIGKVSYMTSAGNLLDVFLIMYLLLKAYSI